MTHALFILSLLGFVIMFALPRVFFRSDGRKNAALVAHRRTVRLARRACGSRGPASARSSSDGGAALATTLDALGMVVTVGAIALIAATVATHRVPLALWHQDGEQNTPMHIVTYGPYGWVRHPFYVSFLLLLVGAALIARDGITLAALPLGLISLDWTARNEETKLLASTPR